MREDSGIRLSKCGRFYMINGEQYVRVTHTIKQLPKPWLDRWRLRVGDEEADRIANETAWYGDMIHLVTEYHDKYMFKERDALVKECPWLVPYIVAWMVWSKERIEKWIWVERIAYHSHFRVAGRIDRMGIFYGDASPTIVDIKSGTSLADTIGIQLYLYRSAAMDTIRREELGEYLIPDRTVVAHLPGPRYDENGNNKTLFDKVIIKPYECKRYQTAAIECVQEFWNLAT